MTKLFAVLTCMILVLSLAACGASAPKETAAAADCAAPAEMWNGDMYDVAEEESGVFEPAAGVPDAAKRDAKIIYTANMDLETTEFDKAVNDIAAAVERFNGYFENSSQNGYNTDYRYANYTVKVPKNDFNNFLNCIGETCAVTYTSTSAEDITDSYYDVDSRLKTAQTKLDRLQELLAKADNMSDIITIESAISETEWTIENLSGTLRSYDAQVDYATVTIDLNEVYKLSNQEDAPMTFGERLASSFRRGLTAAGNALEDLVLWFAFNWIGLLIALVVLAVLLVLLRRARRKSRSLRGSGEKRPRRRFITVEKLTEEEMNEEENKEE